MGDHELPEGSPHRVESSSSSEDHETEKITTHNTNEHNRPHFSSRPSFQRHDSLALMSEDDRRELERIATARSQVRRESVIIPEEDEEEDAAANDPTLDPSSGSFDMLRWLEYMLGELRKEGIKPAQAGVAWKNLKVSGTGDALQLQQTIGSWVQAPLRIGEHLSFRKKEHKTILNNFDGIMRSGELLVVLGRPGSGCSTLLKSMTGQLHGLIMDKNSVVHYNGVSQHQMMKEFKGEAIYNQEVCYDLCSPQFPSAINSNTYDS